MKKLVDIYNYQELYSDLYNIMNLEYNWNGYGAMAGTAYPYERATPIITLLQQNRLPPPDITATSNRTIQLEWRSSHSYLEFELFDDKINVLKVVYDADNTSYMDRNYTYDKTDYAIEQVKEWCAEFPFLR